MSRDDQERYLRLCARIRAHCAEQGWFGPDGDIRFRDEERYYLPLSASIAGLPCLHDQSLRGCPYRWRLTPGRGWYEIVIDRTQDPVRKRFALPLATDAQIAATEAALGYPLPAMLRELYLEVANGGFGPDYGIYGVQGGWSMDEDDHYFTLDQWRRYERRGRNTTDVSLSALGLDLTAPCEVPGRLRPVALIPVCYSGCGADTSVDFETGEVYLVGSTNIHDGDGNYSIVLHPIARSVEEWLELWLDDNAHYRVINGNSDPEDRF